jgi:hypothetical protein
MFPAEQFFNNYFGRFCKPINSLMIYHRTNIFLREVMAKTCPSCGYREPDMQSMYCNKCGYPFPQNQPGRPAAATAPASRPAPRTAKRPVHKKAGGGGFLSFGTLITGNHLKLIYILGAVMIVLVSIMGITGMFTKKVTGGANVSITDMTAIGDKPTGAPLFWFGFLIAGSVLWRMFCEIFVMLSRVQGVTDHGDEDAYEEDVEEYADEGFAAPGSAGSGQMVECPRCHKIVPIEDLRECEHCGVQGCSNCIRRMGLLKKTMTCRECFEAK